MDSGRSVFTFVFSIMKHNVENCSLLRLSNLTVTRVRHELGHFFVAVSEEIQVGMQHMGSRGVVNRSILCVIAPGALSSVAGSFLEKRGP